MELVGREVTERLVWPAGLEAAVPGDEGGFEARPVGGQVVDVEELIVVGAEGALDAAVALGIVGAVERELGGGVGELTEEL